jgi:hypothetical protein
MAVLPPLAYSPVHRIPYPIPAGALFHGLKLGMPIALSVTSVHERKLRCTGDDDHLSRGGLWIRCL